METGTKTVLLTGFEPFDGGALNPSARVAERLHGQTVADRRVVGAVLPCVFGASLVELKRQLKRVKPELVICMGQAGGRSSISLERVAINVDDARIPDNAGAQPIDAPIATRGPVGYWSTLPIKAIVEALNEAGVAAAVSQTAGTYVCNHVFYGLMRTLKRRKGVRGGFVHVPNLPEQAPGSAASMPLERMVQGLEIAIRVSLQVEVDRRITGGATH